jgi:hypothetical protein
MWVLQYITQFRSDTRLYVGASLHYITQFKSDTRLYVGYSLHYTLHSLGGSHDVSTGLFLSPSAVVSGVPLVVMAPSVSCVARVRTVERAITSRGSAPAPLDGWYDPDTTHHYTITHSPFLQLYSQPTVFSETTTCTTD